MSKRRKEKQVIAGKDRVSIKYVKRANLWCKTTISGGKQIQSWSVTEPK